MDSTIAAGDWLGIPIGFLIELSETGSEQEVFDAYARWTRVVVESDRATVAIATDDAHLKLLAIEGNQAIATGALVPVDGTMIGRVYRSQMSEICGEMAGSDLLDLAKLAQGGLTACIDVPLVCADRCFGALAVGFHDAARATHEELLKMEAMGRCLASYLLLHRQVEQLSTLSVTDPLTRAFNRRFFQEKGQEAWEAWTSTSRPFSIAILDLDHFKRINDTHGHDFGDEVLQGVAGALSEELGPNDLLVRMGGEEFCVVFLGQDMDVAAPAAERMRARIASLALTAPGGRVPVTASLGVASAHERHGDMGALTRAADAALYRAKSEGRNRVVLAA